MDVPRKNISAEKSNGRFYTPHYIVQSILNMSGYCGVDIVKKHVIDNSCGDGAFLVEIVARYCESAKQAGFSNEEIVQDLCRYIHGIEIDKAECEKCIRNVSAVAQSFDLPPVKWDIQCADTMEVKEYDGKMDFVLGNPPYVRVHNFGDVFDRVKQFSFAQTGMTDIYIVFYEIGLKMLNQNGVLGYITPSSFFNSLAGATLREYLIKNNLIEKIIDLKHYQAFAATAYTAIAILKKARETNFTSYYRFDEQYKTPHYIDRLTPDDFYICGNFYFSNRTALHMLQTIFYNSEHCDVAVKNGFATLCDDVFIGDFDFDSSYIIPVIKASTGKCARIFYPYGKDSKLIPESELRKDRDLYQYLFSHKSRLTERSSEGETDSSWYAFGRSQAINDTYKNKLAVNTLLRSTSDLKLIPAPAGIGVYGGLYLVGDETQLEMAKEALMSDDFVTYISLLGKYKSGGYYTFSSKEVKAFLDYKLAHEGGHENDDK